MFSFIAYLVSIVLITALFSLPAFIELKKPKDCGPRFIVGIQAYSLPFINIDEDYRLDKILLNRLSLLLAAMPNLESLAT